MTLVDWIFRVLSVLLALSACWALVWAMWRDRPPWRPVKPRCPQCWYDLTGVARGEQGWFCVECAHVVTKKRDLHRTCRRAWTFVPVLFLAGASVLAWAWPTIDRDGWRAAVPTWVIVHLWPIDEVAWMEGRGTREPMIKELDRRVDHNKASGTELTAWARRVDAAYQSRGRGCGAPGTGANGPPVGSAATPKGVLLCVDLSAAFENLAALDEDSQKGWSSHRGLVPGREPVPSAIVNSAMDGLWIPNTQESIIGILKWTVSPDSWLDNGGDDVTYRWSGTSLLLLGPRETLEQIERCLAGLEKACALAREEQPGSVRVPVCDQDGVPLVCRNLAGLDLGPEFALSSRCEVMDAVRRRVLENVEPETWLENGGNVGIVLELGPLFIVHHMPDVQTQIDGYLAGLRAGQRP